MTEAGDRARLLFDWAAAQHGSRRLALWLLAAVLLHGGAYLLFRVTYPPLSPTRISDATLYVLLPNSPQAQRLEPFLAAADPALFAPERMHGREMPVPPIPAYQPSFAAATPLLEPLPDSQPRVLPPLIRDFGPVPVAEAPAARPVQPAPATATQVVFSAPLQARAPSRQPKIRFVARPGDQLAPARFLIAVAPDGRVLHVLKDPDSSGIAPGDENKALDDAASQFLMNLWFQRGPDSQVAWGTATFHWGLDVKREEPH
jgi:hypothetical protein